MKVVMVAVVIVVALLLAPVLASIAILLHTMRLLGHGWVLRWWVLRLMLMLGLVGVGVVVLVDWLGLLVGGGSILIQRALCMCWLWLLRDIAMSV